MFEDCSFIGMFGTHVVSIPIGLQGVGGGREDRTRPPTPEGDGVVGSGRIGAGVRGTGSGGWFHTSTYVWYYSTAAAGCVVMVVMVVVYQSQGRGGGECA